MIDKRKGGPTILTKQNAKRTKVSQTVNVADHGSGMPLSPVADADHVYVTRVQSASQLAHQPPKELPSCRAQPPLFLVLTNLNRKMQTRYPSDPLPLGNHS
jgi:hypothetical protein